MNTHDSTPATDIHTPEEESPSESEISELEHARQSFEQLRQVVLETLGEDTGFQINLQRFLANYSSDTILLAALVRYPDLGSDIYSGESTENRYRVMEAAVCDYKLKGTNLIEGEYTIVPILVKVKKTTDQVQEVTVPELHDLNQKKQDIIDIFGVESEEELGLSTNGCDEETRKRIWRVYEEKLSAVKCQIALSGGFSGFEDRIVKIYSEIKNGGYLDKNTEEGAVRSFFMENKFAYNILCVPYWHELGRESGDDETTLYLTAYIGHIQTTQEGTLTADPYYSVYALTIKADGAQYQVIEYKCVDNPDLSHVDEIDACVGKFTPAYINFSLGQGYSEWISYCNEKIGEVINGVYDFSGWHAN